MTTRARNWPWSMLDAQRLEIVSRDECRDLVARARVGRIAFWLDGDPTVLPVNHVVDAWSIAFRTTYGSKLLAAVRQERVAFEVDDLDPETRLGWSVLVRGTAEHVTDPATIRRLDALTLDVLADGIEREQWVRIPMSEVTGRRLTR